MENKTITVQTIVHASIEKVWAYWNEPEHITHWAFASDDWEAPRAENDLRTGGTFSTRMQAKDGSAGFDFGGTYTDVKENELIEYEFGGRHARVEFVKVPEGVKIIETFEMEHENPEEMQRGGWQSILDNFRKYAENQ